MIEKFRFLGATALIPYRMWNVLSLDDRILQYIVHVGT